MSSCKGNTSVSGTIFHPHFQVGNDKYMLADDWDTWQEGRFHRL